MDLLIWNKVLINKKNKIFLSANHFTFELDDSCAAIINKNSRNKVRYLH